MRYTPSLIIERHGKDQLQPGNTPWAAPVRASNDMFPAVSLAYHVLDEGLGASNMKDMVAQLEKLRRDAAECQLISDLATDSEKRELFARLAAHHRVLASEIEKAIAAKEGDAA